VTSARTDPTGRPPALAAEGDEGGRHANRAGQTCAQQAESTERGALAARQISLVSALVAGGSPPAGVDPERIRVQALALLRKRFRSVARYRPEFAADLGTDFWPAFQRYAAAAPTPPTSTSHEVKRFARYLRRTRRRPLLRLLLPKS
jgi:hypothetical protein